jgi:DNA-binding transcriptional LysR family regulator
MLESKDRPQGTLKVTATVALGSTWLAPRMREFIEVYPEVEVRLLLEDRELDLSMREADVAVRMRPPHQPDLVKRLLFTVHIHLYAATGYVKKHGMPKTVEDLDKHRVIAFDEETIKSPVPNVNWLLTLGRADGPRRPALSINNVYGLQRAVQSGLGIASLPDFMAQSQSDLVQVLPDLDGPTVDAYFVYPEELRNTRRIQVFRDFLLRKVSESRF